jgi:chromosome segregation ATPase
MFKRIKKLENEINDLKKEIKESKEKIQDLKEKLYENLDNQKINELSKKYKAKINFRYEYCRCFLEINNHTVVDTKLIINCHEYIQSGELERDIKAFLYKSNKGER